MMKNNHGFTLVEVLLASAILAMGMLAIFASLTPCIAMINISKQFQEVRWEMGVAELKYPFADFEDIEDIVVEETDDFGDQNEAITSGYRFSRTIDEKVIEDDIPDDGLYVVRTRVSWGESEEASEEIVQLVWKKDGGDYPP